MTFAIRLFADVAHSLCVPREHEWYKLIVLVDAGVEDLVRIRVRERWAGSKSPARQDNVPVGYRDYSTGLLDTTSVRKPA
jgi:hypothetical protein